MEWFFRSLLSPLTVIGLNLVKCVPDLPARVFGVIYSLVISLSQTVRARNEIEKLAHMPAKLKCKDLATEQSKSGKRKCRRRSVVHTKTQAEFEGHTSGIEYHIYPHIVNYNYNFAAKTISGYNIFCYISVSF